jgi:hypothetical protein
MIYRISGLGDVFSAIDRLIEVVIRIFRLLSHSCTLLSSLEMSASLFPSKHLHLCRRI